MKQRVTTLVRVLFGVFFVVMGLNSFFHFMPQPTHSIAGTNLLIALGNAGYFFPFIAGLEIVTGLMLALNLFAPLGLILLAPLIVNIAFYHLFLDSISVVIPVMVVVVELFLAIMYWDNFAHLFKRK